MARSSGYVRDLIAGRTSAYYEPYRLKQLAAQELQRLSDQGSTTSTAPIDLLDFVPLVSPELEAPRHLERLARTLEKAEHTPTRLVVNTPPQHGKSTLVFHWIAQALRGSKRILYITYSDAFALSQMRIARPIAERAGVVFRSDSRALCEWNLENGGSLYATGSGGSITGRPGGLIVIDDPIKDWTEAQSRTIRDTVFDWLRSSVLTRAHPSTSVVVVQTRWHEDDVSGRLLKQGWEGINLKAISDEGKALWPEARPLEWLQEQKKQVGDHIFAALYQGDPRPLGGSLFKGVNYYDKLPNEGRYVVGMDLAYSSKNKADYSVAVVLCKDGERYYVVDVIRKQVSAPEFCLSLKSLQATYKSVPMVWHCAGTELGLVDWLKDRGVTITAKSIKGDKFVRAQPASALWNSGNLLVPRNAPWLDAFLIELLEFTGAGDAHDDQVDSLSSAVDALKSMITGAGLTGTPRTTSSLKGFY
mgnify:CR=1 FL=1